MNEKITGAIDTYVKGGNKKKKIIVAAAALLLVVVIICVAVGCSDGKCDVCGEPALEGAAQVAKTQGVKLDGEYCSSCMQDAVRDAMVSKAFGG